MPRVILYDPRSWRNDDFGLLRITHFRRRYSEKNEVFFFSSDIGRVPERTAMSRLGCTASHPVFHDRYPSLPHPYLFVVAGGARIT